MSKIIVFVLLSFITITFYSQNNVDSLIIKDTLKHKHSGNRYCFPEGDCATRMEMGLDCPMICFYSITFSTNKLNVIYSKTYYENHTLSEEGALILEKERIKWYRRKRQVGYKYGIWKKYDYKKNQLLYILYKHTKNTKGMDDYPSDTIRIEPIKK